MELIIPNIAGFHPLKKISKAIFGIVLSVLFLSCNNGPAKDNFYSYNKTSDLWRLPLLEPYELISPTKSGDWFLVLEQPDFNNNDFFNTGNEFQLSNIESIGIRDSVIVIHSTNIYWPKLGGSYNTTLLIDAKTGNKFIFSNQHHRMDLSEKLEELKVKTLQLRRLEDVWKAFQARLSLPEEWYQNE